MLVKLLESTAKYSLIGISYKFFVNIAISLDFNYYEIKM